MNDTQAREHNADVIKGLLGAWGEFDVDAAVQQVTEDVVVHVHGKNVLSGLWKGQRQYRNFLTRAWKTLGIDLTLMGEPELIVLDTVACAKSRVHVRSAHREYEWDRLVIYRFRSGLISEMWMFEDDEPSFDKIASIIQEIRERPPTEA